MTPEGSIKAKIKHILDLYDCYYFMPVQRGYGPAGLDFHCVLMGGKEDVPIAFFIEAKAPGKGVIKGSRQDDLIKKLRTKYYAEVFIINDKVTLAELEKWLRFTMLDKTEDSNERARPTTEQDGGVSIPE